MTAPYFDAHCDTLSALTARGRDGEDLWSNTLHVDLKRGAKYSPRAQIFAIFAETGSDYGREFDAQYELFIRQMERYSDKAAFCRSKAEIENAVKSGKTAAMLSVEGAELLDCSLEKLQKAHALGVRALNLTWNRANALSGSCAEESERGLSEEGRAFVRECGRLGIMTDVSHLSEKGFWDVAEISEKPFIASHSNSYSVCKNRRNLTDEQFKRIVEAGGVAGINMYADFLGNGCLDAAVRHVLHFLELGGENNIALGADLDGCSRLPREINGIEDMELFYDALLHAGVGKETADKIFFTNMIGVVKTICDI